MSEFGLQLKAALVGDFDAELERGRKRVTYAVQSALKEAATDLKTKLQIDVNASGLHGAEKLAKTWKDRIYGKTSLNPAALIMSKAPLIIEAFERGEEIRSSRGVWLAIPNPALKFAAPRLRGVGRRQTVRAYEQKYGKLRYQHTHRANLALLVTDLRRGKTGGFKAVSNTARKRGNYETVVVFFLVPKIRQPRLLRGATIRERAERDFPTKFQGRFEYHLEQAERGPASLTFAGTVEQ